ncbi:MAG: CoA pyrophosphatase [Gammaproteobacteria bacterium]|nr:CoA pyrophosphatase [Gammaproteobacteria bacterium]
MQAAVAMVLRDGEHGTEILMMQRAHHDGDPWSGQMAFPGGKIDPDDHGPQAAAERETLEEVGLRLGPQDYIGRLDDVYGLKVNGQYSVLVSSFVYKPTGAIELTPNYEVADLVWLPTQFLAQRDNAHDFYHPHAPEVKMPAVMINETKQQVLWGLSLRILTIFYDLVGWELAVLSDRDQQDLRDIENRDIVRRHAKNIAKAVSRSK